MNKLILCEGKTDAVFISYYLEIVHGWTHKFEHSRLQKAFKEGADRTRGESIEWYRKDEDYLLICAVGGRENFNKFIKNKILPAMIDSSLFSRIAIVTDRDDRDEQRICESVRSFFEPMTLSCKNNVWMKSTYQNSYSEKVGFEFLLLIIPPDKEGALEIVFMDAISENDYDRVIVEKAKSYVEDVEPFASRYINKNRLKPKACLGVVWATQFPENTFVLIDDQIRSVNWSKFDIIEKCFKELMRI